MPFDQERRDYLNEKYPSAGHPRSYEREFRDNTIDRQVDNLMNDARNLKRFNDNKLMVPSDAELRYRANIPPPTNPDNVIIPREPLSEGLLKRDRPNPTPPTDKPRPIPDAPRTSPASPPPTPRTSGGAGNLLDMQVAPPTASPRQTLPAPNPAPGAKPGGLPGPAGRIGYPAAGAAVDFAFRLNAGQPLGQAAAGAVGSGLGSAAGFAAGSVLGPAGAFAGGMIGGYLGGMAGSALYDLAFPPTAEAPKDQFDPKTGPPPFYGGQGNGIAYDVTIAQIEQSAPLQITFPTVRNIRGPIFGLHKRTTPGYGFCFVVSGGGAGETFVHNYTGNPPFDYQIQNIVTSDGSPDIAGNPPSLPIPQDNRTPDSVGHPGNDNFAPPTASPPPNPSPTSAPPTQAPNPAPNNYAPGGLNSKSGGNPRGDSPDWIPKGVPTPVPHPNYSPLPVAGLPGTAPSGSPSSTGAPGPNAAGNPNRSPFTFTPDGTLMIVSPGHPATTGNPATNPADTSFPGSLQPNPLVANPLSPGGNFSNSPSPDTGTPSGMPTTVVNPTTPDAYRETPVVPAPATPPTTTPTTPSEPIDIDKIRDEINKVLGPTAIAIAGITALLNPIANNTTPEALRDAAETGTCRTLQPGGCMAPIAQNAANAANNSANNGAALSGLMAFLQGLQAAFLQPILAGVNLVNTKLGPVMAGADGIGGFLKRAYEATHIDKVLNAMNTVLLVHNAAMLSRNLGSTLGDLTSQALSTIGIKDAEGSPIDINKEIGTQVNTFMENLVGAEVWKGTKTSWNKASSIISSATNIMYTVRSMFDSGREILEWSAENTGKIGNALKKYRIVGEDAYKWMPERVTVQNAFTRRLDRIREGTDSLDDAASSLTGVLGEVQSIQQEYADLQEQKQRFDANIKDLTPKPREENKPVADAVTAARGASKAPSNMPQVFRGEGESNE